ncbi:MAG: energy transducer TonB [Sphingobacteriaceae bacterium]|nr:energy transducer TonB [Sphingobacteriaceae bacterium]
MNKQLTLALCLLGMFATAQTKTTASAKKTTAKKETKAVEVTTIPDRKAEYVGGNDAMEKYIIANLKYPAKLETDTSIKTRKVFMKFMVDKTGKVTDVSVMKGIKGCKDCSEEAIRVVSTMPNWSPAIEANQAIDSWFTLPISFAKK